MSTKPWRVFSSPLTGQHYISRAYRIKDMGNGRAIVTITGKKYDVTEDIEAIVADRTEELARERDTLRSKLDDLLAQRMDEAEGKLATRPAEAVVGELEGKVRKLADILRSLVDLQEGPPLPSTAPVWELVMDEAFDALKEVEGGA